jgi:hypothetical protein
VAICTILYFFVANELPFVVILMAIGAKIVLQRIGVFGFMAGLAIDEPVFPFQRVVGAGVVEITDPFDQLKRLLCMATCAILSEPVVMYIFMATVAIGIFEPFENLELFSVAGFHLMAFYTFYFPVFTQ